MSKKSPADLDFALAVTSSFSTCANRKTQKKLRHQIHAKTPPPLITKKHSKPHTARTILRNQQWPKSQATMLFGAQNNALPSKPFTPRSRLVMLSMVSTKWKSFLQTMDPPSLLMCSRTEPQTLKNRFNLKHPAQHRPQQQQQHRCKKNVLTQAEYILVRLIGKPRSPGC